MQHQKTPEFSIHDHFCSSQMQLLEKRTDTPNKKINAIPDLLFFLPVLLTGLFAFMIAILRVNLSFNRIHV